MALIADVEKLSVKDGDVIVLKALGGPCELEDAAEHVMEMFRATGRGNCVVLVLSMDMSVSVIPEEVMKHFDWVRPEGYLRPEPLVGVPA